jgi:hypothetical protein
VVLQQEWLEAGVARHPQWDPQEQFVLATQPVQERQEKLGQLELLERQERLASSVPGGWHSVPEE